MRIHLDHNATTPLRAEARARWLEVTDALAGNPSSLHAGGRRARAIVDEARARLAEALGVAEDELVFTSGGTESNNLALQGVLRAHHPDRPERDGLVTSAAEHSSVRLAAHALADEGYPVATVGVGRNGLPDLDELGRRLATGPRLVSMMAANNEVGCVSDLAAIRARLEAAPGRTPLLHTDAVQALGRIPLDLQGWGADLASFSAHKVGGPVGVGVLWCRSGLALAPLFHGGEQERGLRPGTEDVAGIAAAVEAMVLAVQEQHVQAQRAGALLLELWENLRRSVPDLELVGPELNATSLATASEAPSPMRADAPRRPQPTRLPNTLCVRVPNTDGKVLVTRLDLAGIEVSAGSACASGSIEPSHVLLAMGYGEDEARAALRLSLGRSTSREECTQVADLLRELFVASRAT